MIYGKASAVIEAAAGRTHLTVSHLVCIKQNNDLIRLSIDEARELAQDILEGIEELFGGPAIPPNDPLSRR